MDIQHEYSVSGSSVSDSSNGENDLELGHKKDTYDDDVLDINNKRSITLDLPELNTLKRDSSL